MKNIMDVNIQLYFANKGSENTQRQTNLGAIYTE